MLSLLGGLVLASCTTGGSGGGSGVDGSDGVPGFQVDGTDGQTGTDGTTNADGTDGAEGSDGSTGTDGTDGTDLEPGQICAPGTAQCVSETAHKVCNVDGTEFVEAPCPNGGKCWLGQCGPVICTPGDVLPECGSPTALLVCNDVGTNHALTSCDGGKTCYAGQCVNFVCQPDAVACVGFGSLQQCRSDGSGWDIVEQCEKGGTCFEGACISACEVDLKAATYTGCEYFAVDLDNIEGGEFEPVAIVVSVPKTVEDSVVTITNMFDGHIFTAAELGAPTLTVPAGSLGVFYLPPGQDISGSGTSKRSYFIKTSSPATVHQFNPLNGDGVYTNDASLLLPTAVAGKEYYVMSWPMRQDDANTLRGFATVVASEPGQTLVTVTPRSDVNAGTGGMEYIAAGSEVDFLLDQGDVLNLEADGGQGADLTGTRIVSDQAVIVFGGHECANVPLGINACDHLEQQLVPVQAWGNRYIADVFHKRSPTQFDIIRVMAGGTDVVVKTSPPQAGYEEFLLQPGASVTFAANSSFEISASGRILVGHFMIGSSYPGHFKACENTGIGDPAFTLAVPTQQFLSDYTVLTPPGYVQNYLNITAPAGAEVTVDGQPISVPLSQVGDLDWGVAQVPVSVGVHTISAKKKIGLTAYGYDCDVSYAYPGGLRLLNLGE